MSVEYWECGLSEVLASEGIGATPAQIARMAKRLDEGASVEADYTGISEQTRASNVPAVDAEKEALRYVVDKLSQRLGVSVNVMRRSIGFYEPCGTSHAASVEQFL